MKRTLRFVGQAACLLLVAAGLLAALVASFCLLAMLIVWFQEETLHSEDWTIFAAGVKWLLGSGVLIGVVWWLRGKIVPTVRGNNSFRLVDSKSGHLEKLVQDIFEMGSVVLLALWLWPRVPGSALLKVPGVAGWLLVCFLGYHARIALHELGHLAAAWFVGFDLRKVQVGIGPLLWSRTFANGLLCEWRVWARGGFVLATPRNTQGFRAGQSLIVAAGPLADLILLWLTYQLIARAFGGLGAAFLQGAGGLMAFALFWWTALSAAGGLVPLRGWMGSYKVGTDGYWLLRLWSGSDPYAAEFACNTNWRELLELSKSGGPENVRVPGAGEQELPASLVTFREQRERLRSSRLRERPLISSLPV